MHKAEYRKGDIIAAIIGNNTLIVNEKNDRYYLEKNKYIGKYIIQHYFMGEKTPNIEKLDDYVKDVIEKLVGLHSYPEMEEEYILYLELTNNCNLFCKHCYNDSNSEAKKIVNEMSFEVIEKLIMDSLKSMKFKAILSGGEPVLHPKFEEILKLLYKNGIPTTVYTNGIDIIKFEKLLALYNVNIVVSLDGACEKDHDFIRGEGVFQNTIRAISSIVKTVKREKITLSFTINKYNYQSVEEMIKLATEYGISRVFINPVFPLGRNKESSIDMNASELAVFWSHLVDLQGRFQDVKIICDTFWKIKIIDKNCYIPSDCSICKKIRISAVGDVYPCTFFSDRSILNKNINRDTNILKGECYSEIIKIANSRYLENCSNCIFSVFCKGGCPAAGYKNQMWEISELECTAKSTFYYNQISNMR